MDESELASLPTVVRNAYLASLGEPVPVSATPATTGLTLPSPQELQEFREGISDVDAIQRAADLFTLATGVSSTTTAIEERLVRSAILEMAWAITTRHEDLEEQFSPFTGERIGSYSYNKAVRSVADGTDTGVPAFDNAVSYFMALALNSKAFATDTEWVFEKGFDTNSPLIGSHDPNYSFEGEHIPWPSGPPVNVEDDGVVIGKDEHGFFIEET